VLRGELHPGRPLALLLPGGGQTRASWARTARSLAAEGLGAAAVDLRGHGESDWSASGEYGVDALVADAVACCRALPEPPVLVGASLSGLTGLLAAAKAPESVRGLVMVDIAIDIQPAGVSRVHAFMTTSRDGFDTLAEFATAVAGYTGSPPAAPDRMRRHARRRPDGRWYWHWDPAFIKRPPDFPRPRLVTAAAALSVPTLVVRGQLSDVVSRADAEATRALIPGATVLDVADTGHMVTGDDNAVFATGLGRFVAAT